MTLGIRMRWCALALALGWGLGLLACGSPAPPSEGRRRVVLATEYDDRSVGQQSSEEVRVELGLVDAPELTEYVRAVGRRLTRFSPGFHFEYSFHIVDQDAPNAFALPGGFIYVSRGLLALTNSEDELANVLGHEIIHVARRHASARQGVAPSSPLEFNWLRIQSLAAYNRDQEREADRLGQGLAALAGYDPQGMATFLKNLEFTVRLELGHTRWPTFLDTHPGTVERAAGASARADKIRWRRQDPIAPDRADYLRRLDGLAIGGSAAEGVFQGNRFLHPELGFSMRFPDRWELRNSPRAVGAISPDRRAQVFLELQGSGDDPTAAATEYLAKAISHGFVVESEGTIQLLGRPAYRAIGRAGAAGGAVRVNLTWLVWGDSVYRVTGVTSTVHANRFEGIFVATVRSFRPLTPEQRASIEEVRLRLVAPRPGESLSQFNARTGNQWDLQRTAVMNDMFANQDPEPGRLLKVAVRERYQSKPH